MVKTDRMFAVLVAAAGAIILSGFCAAETYHLSPEKGWQNVANMPEGEYLLAISKIKQQLSSGNDAAVMDALKKLKADFPGLAGEEIDAFIEAEKLYSKGSWDKAAATYKKFMDDWPDSLLYPAAMERLFSIGTAYLQGQKRTFIKILRLPAFDDGVNIMWDIADRAGNLPIALRALTTLAENQERRKQYFDAYQTWSEVAARWPTGKTGEHALLRMAQELHASYSGTQYDAAALLSAKSYYEDFIARYPTEAQQMKINDEIAMIEEQRAYKEYQTGFYYERTGKPQVAKIYYRKVTTDWPDSKAAAMVKIRLSPDAPSAVPQDTRHKLFNIGNVFLDNWFGVKLLTGSKTDTVTN